MQVQDRDKEMTPEPEGAPAPEDDPVDSPHILLNCETSPMKFLVLNLDLGDFMLPRMRRNWTN